MFTVQAGQETKQCVLGSLLLNVARLFAPGCDPQGETMLQEYRMLKYILEFDRG